MFEGQPIPHPSYEFLAAILLSIGLGLWATVLLRIRFEREWSLTIWTSYNIKRVWQLQRWLAGYYHASCPALRKFDKRNLEAAAGAAEAKDHGSKPAFRCV